MLVMVARHSSRSAPATTAIGAAAGPATAAVLVIMSIAIGILTAGVGAERLENHVEVELDTKPRP